MSGLSQFSNQYLTMIQIGFCLPYIYSDTLCSESGAAAAVLPVTTDFLLLITLLKSIICVKELHPLIILSMSVQSVLIPSVLFRPGKWYSCTLNNERLEYLNTNFGFQNSDKQQKVCRNQEVSSCCSTFRAQWGQKAPLQYWTQNWKLLGKVQ